MKKRIIISILSLFVIAVGVFLVKPLLNKGEQDTEEDSGGYSTWSSEVRYYPESGLNFDAVGGEVWIEAPHKHTFTMDTEVTDGGVAFNVYYYDKPNEKAGDLIRSEHITETGVYTYNLDDLSDGCYWLEVKRDNKDVRVNVKYEFIQERPN